MPKMWCICSCDLLLIADERRFAVKGLNAAIASYRVTNQINREDDETIPKWFHEAATEAEDLYEMRRFAESVELLSNAKSFCASIADNPEKSKLVELRYSKHTKVFEPFRRL